MSKNLDQVYIANPITTNANTDLMYFMQSPYTAGTDAGMLYSDFAAQLPTPTQIQEFAFNTQMDSSVGANAYVGLYSPAIAAYSDVSGAILILASINFTNTGASTISYNGLAPIPLVGNDGNALVAGNIVQNLDYAIVVDPSGTYAQVLNPTAVGGGVTAAQVQQGAFNVFSPASASGVNYTGTLSPVPTLTDGMTVVMIPDVTNTSAIPNLNLNGLGNVGIRLMGNNPLTLGDISTFYPAVLVYCAAFSFWELTNPVFLNEDNLTKSKFLSYPCTGSVNAYAASPYSYAGGYSVANQVVVINGLPASNTGAATFTYGLSDSPIAIELNGSALVGGEMLINGSYVLIKNAANNKWQLINSSLSSGGSSPWVAGAGTNSAIGGDGSCTATGAQAIAFGNNSGYSNGTCAFSLGHDAETDGNFSFSMGYQTRARGNYQFVFGSSNSRAGSAANNSFVFGDNCTVGTASSFSFSFGNTANVTNIGSWVIHDSHASSATDLANDQWNAAFDNGFNFWIKTSSSAVIAAQIDTAGNLMNNLGERDQSLIYSTPITGDTVTIATTSRRHAIIPAGTLATLTVQLPASPLPGQLQTISTTQIITALTVDGNGHTVLAPPTTLAAGQAFTYIFNLAGTTWVPTA